MGNQKTCLLRSLNHNFHNIIAFSILFIFLSEIVIAQIIYPNLNTVNLETAQNYRALSGTHLTIGPGLVLNGNAGGGTAVFNNGVVTGTIDEANEVVNTAIDDLLTANTELTSREPDVVLAEEELSGKTFGRGIYSGTGIFSINGELTLTGTMNDIFIFKSVNSLSSTVACVINLTGGAIASNVFWQVGSAPSIEGDFKGNIIADNFITQNGGTLDGKAMGLDAVTLNGVSVLPVELLNFSGEYLYNHIVLSWKTASEINNYGFEIQRSSILFYPKANDNYSWEIIDFVKGSGQSNSLKNYLYTDKTVKPGSFAYRLKQIDNDGNHCFSNIIEVKTEQTTSGILLNQNYPNPFNPLTKIQFVVNKNTHAKLTILNVIGEIISTPFNGRALPGEIYDIIFNGEKLVSGIYFYKLQTEEKSVIRKMILVR